MVGNLLKLAVALSPFAFNCFAISLSKPILAFLLLVLAITRIDFCFICETSCEVQVSTILIPVPHPVNTVAATTVISIKISFFIF